MPASPVGVRQKREIPLLPLTLAHDPSSTAPKVLAEIGQSLNNGCYVECSLEETRMHYLVMRSKRGHVTVINLSRVLEIHSITMMTEANLLEVPASTIQSSLPKMPILTLKIVSISCQTPTHPSSLPTPTVFHLNDGRIGCVIVP